MIAVDTNVLVYAHHSDTARHERAQRWLRRREHGVERVLTEDRDFGRFPFLPPQPTHAPGPVPSASAVVHWAP